MPDQDSRTKRPLALLQPTVTRGFASRLRFTRLQTRFPGRAAWALFMFVNGFITIAILAGVAMVSHTPFVFPSLGPTAILLFYTPLSPTASPRHTIYGHAIGIACGYGSLLLTGLHHAAPATVVGVDSGRILAAALSLAATSAAMILLKSAHPPAGATTLIPDRPKSGNRVPASVIRSARAWQILPFRTRRISQTGHPAPPGNRLAAGAAHPSSHLATA